MIINIVIGLAGGFAVAGGVFALLTKVGVITRLIGATGTKRHLSLYQYVIILGGTLANIPSVFGFLPHVHWGFLVPAGFFTGLFTGALSLALAETIDVLPVVFKKLNIKRSIEWIVLAFALGKMVGSLYQMAF